MTGIEKLRELAVGVRGSVWASTDEPYCESHGLSVDNIRGSMSALLHSIADQIERERACDADTAENVRLVVGSVIDDMERHVSGVEGMDDSPVARWARELREALGRQCRDGESDSVADSPYDAIRPEDREAIAWVREHGGLSHVKDIYHDLRAVVERLGIEWSESEPHGLMDVLDRRLMPEGMEWPRFEDDERVKRPAPKVLNADGVEIRVGDTVWATNGHGPFEVTRIVHADRLRVICDDEESGHLNAYPESLTHRAPVLAADGRPLREGETVYLLHGDWCGVYPCYGYHGGEKLKVVELHTCHSSGGVRCENDTGFACYPQPSQLTHERPDSWERLEEDATKPTCDYFGHVGGETCETCPGYADSSPQGGRGCRYAHMADIVRRARALAERDA